MITLKSAREIRMMREAGRIVAHAHQIAQQMVAPGVTTGAIDQAIEAYFQQVGATPLFKGFPGKVPFPAVTCISVNEQVVHGIPGPYVLKPGDLVSVDTGCRLNGWCGDAAWTYPVGEISPLAKHLMQVGVESLKTAIEALAQESHWSGVARRIMKLVRREKCSLVEEFVGHGIGREMHEPPQVPNYTNASLKKDDFEIRPGLVLAVEPMVNAGQNPIRTLDDHWTVVTRDGLPSVHFEHTIAITTDGPVLLTEGVGWPLS